MTGIMTPKQYYDSLRGNEEFLCMNTECGCSLGTKDEIKRRIGNGAKTRVVTREGMVYCYECWIEIKNATRLFNAMQAEIAKQGEKKKKRKKRKK